MSDQDLESWEDDPSVREDEISRQARNLHINQQNNQGMNFRPNASAASFQPGQSTPQYGQYAQYGQSYGQQQQQQQQYGGAYPQYNPQGYNQYSQGYGQNSYGQSYSQQPAYQPQPPPKQTPIIAKRPSGAEPATSSPLTSKPAAPVADVSGPPVVKTLSVGGDTAAPKIKVLSIGEATPGASSTKAPASADEGAKVAATKAIEKSDKSVASGKTSPSPASGKSSPTPTDSNAAKREADVVAKEQAVDVDEEVLEEVYGKEHVNIIFIGHVDAGKSTLGGSILYATGMVDERTMDKYKREAKEAGRESWWLSWALDLTNEERSKGITVEVGRSFFETEKRRYSILDAPGHKNFVPNMIGGASQADVGILVISARKGEYEAGFEKGGQTREHAILAKTQGVDRLVVAINKMDDGQHFFVFFLPFPRIRNCIKSVGSQKGLSALAFHLRSLISYEHCPERQH